MQLNIGIIDYVIIIGYFVLVLVVSFITKKEQGSKLENYFLAGRRLTLPLFVGTLVSTWYGNILGMGEIAYKHGLVMWLTQGLFWYLIYFFLVFFLVEKIHSSKLFSIPDQLERVYDRRTAVLGAFVNLLILIPAVYVLALGYVCHWMLGFDKSICVIIGSLIPLVYMLKGGFRAVVYTDFIQFVFMFVGVALVLPFAYMRYGGWGFIQANVPVSHLSLTADWSWQLIVAWLLIATWTLVHPAFYQRIFAAEDLRTAKRGVLVSVIFWFAFDMMINFIGLYAFAAMPNLEPSLSLPIFATSVLPVVFKGIFLTGVIATAMSTLDSLSFCSAMSLSYDIYRRIRPQITEEEVMRVNKIALVIVMILGIVMAIYFESLLELMYMRGTIAISALLIPLMGSYFFRKRSPRAAFWSIVLGLLGATAGYLMKQYMAIDVEPIFMGLLFSGLGFFLV